MLLLFDLFWLDVVSEECSAMIVDDVIRVLQNVPRQNSDRLFIRFDEAIRDQTLQPGNGRRRSRLAAHSVAPDDGFRIRDLLLAHAQNAPACPGDRAQGLLPGDGRADLDSRR